MSDRQPAGHLQIRDGQILWADEEAHRLLGYPTGALADMPFEDVLAPQAERGVAGDLQVPALGAIEYHGVPLRMQDGRLVGFNLRGERMQDFCTLWTVNPSARGLRGERLELLSRHDALTRLPNRIPTLEELAQPAFASVRGERGLLAVCYLDVDRFRELVDRFGPVNGDAVLREIARRLKAAVPHGAAVARVGGDEFALLFVRPDEPQARALVDQILARLAHPFRLQEHSARLRTSIGVALMPWGAQPTEVMLQHAQSALFLAKRAGGARAQFFDAEQAQQEQLGASMRLAIKNALTQREFTLAYQPKVDMPRGRVIGFEALVRWQHPERGLLHPDAFVPFIEDDELVERLGDWAIGEAVRQVAEWAHQGVRTAISVNISPRHLLRPDFIDRLAAHLNRFPQLHAGALELEILETTAIKDFEAVATFIRDCAGLGVPVVMDDFGTGYSSLSYLRRLPVAAIKLDHSFVRGMLDDADDRAIVEGILVMAHGLRRQAIAEGVESVAHGDALIDLGCTLGQGYGIARPLPATQVPGWIASFERDPPWGRAARTARRASLARRMAPESAPAPLREL